MIRAFLCFCLCLAVGAGLYELASMDRGYFLIVWAGHSIEMSLWFALFCMLIISLIGWFLFSLVKGSLRNFVNAKDSVLNYSDSKAQARTLDGLIDYIEEDWAAARKKLTRSAPKVKTPLLNYLASARSAYEMGDEQAALELLHQAENSTSKSGLAVAITQARMQLGNAQYEQALASLERAAAIHAEHPVVLNMRQQVYVALKDWSALKGLLPQLAKHNIGTAGSRHQLQVLLHRESFTEAHEKNQHLSAIEQLVGLEKHWNELPSDLKHEPWFLSYYASQLMALGEHEKSEKALSFGLHRHWHGQWLDLYGLLLCADASKPLKTAERWLQQHPDSPHLLLALGRLCMQNSQWGRAADFLKQSLALQERPETYAELARALEAMGESQQSIEHYRQGLLTSTGTLVSL